MGVPIKYLRTLKFITSICKTVVYVTFRYFIKTRVITDIDIIFIDLYFLGNRFQTVDYKYIPTPEYPVEHMRHERKTGEDSNAVPCVGWYYLAKF